MSIFEYNDFVSPIIVGDDNPHNNYCIFCKNILEKYGLNDHWEVNLKEIFDLHHLSKKYFLEEVGMDKQFWELDLEKYSCEVWFNHCNKCGWWRIQKDISVSAKRWQIWQFFYGLAGILKKLDLSDVATPINEISKYLLAKYESRFSLHPKLFEEVTGEVFKNIGYDVLVTGYSNDGGIDVILEKEKKQVGIQVKRYKNEIKVNQIRELIGALFLAGIPQGIFVTTSDFQSGAHKLIEKSLQKGISIELINAQRFYEILSLTTQTEIDLESLKNNSKKFLQNKLHSYNWENPMNSL